MPDLPNSLSLTEIVSGSEMVSDPVNNNFTAIQTAVNALRAALAGGSSGQVLAATDSDTVGWADRASCVRGSVTSAGAVATGSGFTASRSATGIYVVTFTTPFPAAPAVVAMASTSVARIMTLTELTASAVTIQSWDAAGAAADASFFFIAYELG